MKHHFAAACRILDKVFTEKTYVDRAFDELDASDMTEKIVYGVLEENVKCEYILSQLLQKQPQKTVYILLKEGIYALLNLDNVPAYAIVSECVEAAKMLGKGGVAGFVNAVLKKVAAKQYSLPSPDEKNYISVNFSKPQWFVDRMVAQYGKESTLKVLEEPVSDFVHVRINTKITNKNKVCAALSARGEKYTESEVGGLIVRVSDTVKHLFAGGALTYQSPSSVQAVRALAPHNGSAILDLCSAPGGKAVYAAELCPDSVITACELHSHRVNLIEKYAKRMHVENVRPVRADATVFKKEWENKFDFVLADVPCSCFGTFRKHPDVFLQRGDEKIPELAATQRKILENAAKYLKKGGVLVYSTCTLFKEENDDNADYARDVLGLTPDSSVVFLGEDGRYRILPHGEWEGFFIARFAK